MKTKHLPKLQVKPPRKVPKWSWNNPPQVPWFPMTEPSLLTLIQGAVGGFQHTSITSLICRVWRGTENKSKKGASVEIHYLGKEKWELNTQKQTQYRRRIHCFFIPKFSFFLFHFFFLLPPISLPFLLFSPCHPLSRAPTKPSMLYLATIGVVFLRSCPRRRRRGCPRFALG